MSVRVFVFTFF